MKVRGSAKMKCERFIGRNMGRNQMFRSSFSTSANIPIDKTEVSLELNRIYQAHDILNNLDKDRRHKERSNRRYKSDQIKVLSKYFQNLLLEGNIDMEYNLASDVNYYFYSKTAFRIAVP